MIYITQTDVILQTMHGGLMWPDNLHSAQSPQLNEPVVIKLWKMMKTTVDIIIDLYDLSCYTHNNIHYTTTAV